MKEDIIEILGWNHTDTIAFNDVDVYNKAYALYTYEGGVYVLKEGFDIPIEELDETEQKEVLGYVKKGSYRIDNDIQ